MNRKSKRLRIDDVEILQKIQKNSKRAMDTIEMLNSKLPDDDLAMLLTRQSLKHSELYGKATDCLLRAGKEAYRSRKIEELKLRGIVQRGTLFDVSNSNLASQMIMESSREITDVCRSMNHNENAREDTLEIAEEFLNFESVSIALLKKYL